MEYDPDFARSFMTRTLSIAESYAGPHDATLLINCLLGLLIVPRESLIEKIPQDPFEKINEWGINAASITSFGKCEYGHSHEPNLRQLVRRLRNAVAHFKVEPEEREKKVVGFRFKDRNGFEAAISLEELRAFVIRLASYLEKQA